MTTPQPARQRRMPSVADMVRSVAVLLAIIAVLAGVRSCLGDDPDTSVQTVDYEAVAAAAQERAPYELAVPPSLPEGWRATSARFDPEGPVTWHVGILTAGDEYVGIEQSDGAEQDVLDQSVPDAEPAGVAAVDGRPWQVVVSDDPERVGIVRTDGDVVTLLVGTVDEQTLVDLAADLG